MHLSSPLPGARPHRALTPALAVAVLSAAVGGGEDITRIGEPFGKPVYPDPAIGVQHDLDDRRVLQQG